jgi:hypothetical protein
MNVIPKWLALSLLAGTVYGQVPSTNNTSDQHNNTGVGTGALSSKGVNAACPIGEPALSSYQCYNTAVGYDSLGLNAIGGNYNTGVGFVVLYQNTVGYYNTSVGAGALEQNTTGSNNTAVGFGALSSNILGDNEIRSTGSSNTAVGSQSMLSDTTGGGNTASGQSSLYSTTTGSNNSAFGSDAMVHNISGGSNVAVGWEALKNSTDGSNNIAVGYGAGDGLTTTSNNIDIGNIGENADVGIIRIGTAGTHTATSIAGIENTKVTGSAVYITSSGQLGVLASSERYKTDVHPMQGTERLTNLRPVTFHLKNNLNGDLQYGLIAEEVAKVYPELVTRDEKGVIQGVRYEELTPMLLNEVKRQQRQIASLMTMNRATQAAVAKLQSQRHQ